MIDYEKIEQNDYIWLISFEISKILTPIKVRYIHPESNNSNKLTIIESQGDRICHPTQLLFNNELDAKICGVVNFIKLYYSFDPFTISEDISEDMIITAHNLIDYYEENEPDKFLYYWMSYVPNR